MSPVHLVVLKEFEKTIGDQGQIVVHPEERKDQVVDNLVANGLDGALAMSLINDLVVRGTISHSQTSVVGGDTHIYGITSLGKKMLELVAS